MFVVDAKQFSLSVATCKVGIICSLVNLSKELIMHCCFVTMQVRFCSADDLRNDYFTPDTIPKSFK
jgi:hypothetical protein